MTDGKQAIEKFFTELQASIGGLKYTEQSWETKITNVKFEINQIYTNYDTTIGNLIEGVEKIKKENDNLIEEIRILNKEIETNSGKLLELKKKEKTYTTCIKQMYEERSNICKTLGLTNIPYNDGFEFRLNIFLNKYSLFVSVLSNLFYLCYFLISFIFSKTILYESFCQVYQQNVGSCLLYSSIYEFGRGNFTSPNFTEAESDKYFDNLNDFSTESIIIFSLFLLFNILPILVLVTLECLQKRYSLDYILNLFKPIELVDINNNNDNQNQNQDKRNSSQEGLKDDDKDGNAKNNNMAEEKKEQDFRDENF